MKLVERGQNFQNTGDIEMSVDLSDTGTRFKGIGCALRVTFAMSVNISIRGEGVRPTLATSRMSVYLSDTGIGQNTFDTKKPTNVVPTSS